MTKQKLSRHQKESHDSGIRGPKKCHDTRKCTKTAEKTQKQYVMTAKNGWKLMVINWREIFFQAPVVVYAERIVWSL